jgi:hypothetical protein
MSVDVDRLKLLDRLADRVPELDLNQHDVTWTDALPTATGALMVEG